jgi:hypothetical protein
MSVSKLASNRLPQDEPLTPSSQLAATMGATTLGAMPSQLQLQRTQRSVQPFVRSDGRTTPAPALTSAAAAPALQRMEIDGEEQAAAAAEEKAEEDGIDDESVNASVPDEDLAALTSASKNIADEAMQNHFDEFEELDVTKDETGAQICRCADCASSLADSTGHGPDRER